MTLLIKTLCFISLSLFLSVSAHSKTLTFYEEIIKDKTLLEIRSLGGGVLSALQRNYVKNRYDNRHRLSFDYVVNNFESFIKREGDYIGPHKLSKAYNKFLKITRPFRNKLNKQEKLVQEFQAFYTGLFLLIKKGQLMSLSEKDVFKGILQIAKENLKDDVLLNRSFEGTRFWNLCFNIVYGYMTEFPADVVMFAQQNISQGMYNKNGKVIESEAKWVQKVVLAFGNLVTKYGLSDPVNSFWGDKETLKRRILKRSLWAARSLKNEHSARKLTAYLYMLEKDVSTSAADFYKEGLEEVWMQDERRQAFSLPGTWKPKEILNFSLRGLKFFVLFLFKIFKTEEIIFTFQGLCFVFFFYTYRPELETEKNLSFDLGLNNSRWDKMKSNLNKAIRKVKSLSRLMLWRTWGTFFPDKELSKIQKSIHTLFLVTLGYSITLLERFYNEEFASFIDFTLRSYF